MSELVITRGLPASGKTTFARTWVAEDRQHRVRVNRDDLRHMVDHGEWIEGVTEPRIIAARNAVVLELLKRGVSVVVDDTNLPRRVVRDLALLATRTSSEFRVVDFTTVPVEVCLERDALREKPVGPDVINDMYRRFLKGRSVPLPLPDVEEDEYEDETYLPVSDAPRAVIVDIDGTVALMTDRSPFDPTRVGEDLPNTPVIQIVCQLWEAGNEIIFVSGRSSVCREATERWLQEHVPVEIEALYMRAEGDYRKDSIVKRELFDQHIRFHYDVKAVLDDRDQVVRMWRSLGLTVLQVAEGNF